jgi:crotonobetaine/carnitine-CoA ligase
VRRVVAEVLRARVEQAPERPFVRCGGQWLTFRELDEISDRVAAGLAEAGIGKGDVVAFIVPNRQEMVELFFACAKLGVVQVPLNYWLKGQFLGYQLTDCRATTLIVDELGYRSAAPLLPGTAIEQLVLLDDVPGAALPSTSYRSIRECAKPAPRPEVDEHDLVSVIYTSGTTGMPKGCMLPNGYYIALGQAFGGAEWVIPDDRVYTAYPLFHTSGQAVALMSALVNDASIAFAAEFHASTFLKEAAEEGASMLWGVGPMGMAILAQPPAPTDGAHPLRLAVWLPMGAEDQAEFERRFATPVVAEAFGQTECVPATISPLRGPRTRGAAGRSMPYLEIQTVDEGDRPVPPGEVGEIVIRPREPNVMFQGYWGKPEATLEAFRNFWHHTGDLGRFDEDGVLTFVDRKKDALRRRGENVASFELEQAIAAHPDIARVAVTAVPSPLGEDDIKASIVCHPGHPVTPEGLFDYFKNNLPYYAIPRYVDVRDSLPSNALNRIMKHLLRQEGVPESAWDLQALGLSVARGERRG